MSLDLSKLFNVKRLPDGAITAACPACRAEGADSSGNHLWVHKSGAYKCVKSPDDREHSKSIYRLLGSGSSSVEYLDPAPKLTLPQVFPESTLAKLLPDRSYWVARGASVAALEALGGGLAPEDEKGKLSGRYVFPCHDSRGGLVGFAGRLTFESSFAPKWKILGKKSHFVFPQPPLAMGAKTDTIVLVEGIGCVIALGAVGVWNTLCLFGLNISGDQIAYLIAHGIKHIIISTNNEASGVGNNAATLLRARLSTFFNEESVRVLLPPEKDFLDCRPEQVEAWRALL